MNIFDMFVCFKCYFYDWESFSFGDFKKGRLCGILGFVIIVLAKICGSSAYISPSGNQSIYSSDLKGSIVVWSEGERNLLGKDETLCLRILKRMLRKSEQS